MSGQPGGVTKQKHFLWGQVVDFHTHLRDDISRHTSIAMRSGIKTVVYMANTPVPLDSVEAVRESLDQKAWIRAYPVAALTRGLAGKEPTDIEGLREWVVGFSDDGKCLIDLGILEDVLKQGVLVLAHLEPEVETLSRYLDVLAKVGGHLHFQHISKTESVKLLRKARKKLEFTCETCPQYFLFDGETEGLQVNPPLGSFDDVNEIERGLRDGTIDIIASDYAPLPRATGIAGFRGFLGTCFGLVLDGTLSEEQLRAKICDLPWGMIERFAGKKVKDAVDHSRRMSVLR
jgi:dihydroorotase